MVRLYAGETAKKLAEVYRDALARGDEPPDLGGEYGEQSKTALNKLFD
jgi:hypothetical protein